MRKFLCLRLLMAVISPKSNYFTFESLTQGYFLVQKSRILLWKMAPPSPCPPPNQAVVVSVVVRLVSQTHHNLLAAGSG